MPRKKARGRANSDSEDEAHQMQQAPRVKEKTQKAAKKVGGTASASAASASNTRTTSKKNLSTTASHSSSASAKSASKARGASETKRSSARPSSGRSGSPMDTDESEDEAGSVEFDSQDEEDSLDVSVEDEGQIDIEWPNVPTKVEDGVAYYAWVKIDGVRISRGDSVYLRSGTKTPFIGKLVELKHDEKKGSTCSVAWWYRRGDIKGEEMEAKELLLSTHTEPNALQSISTTRRPQIHFGNDLKSKSLASQHVDSFFYYRFYDHTSSQVQTLP